jgi:hypothetical protein
MRHGTWMMNLLIGHSTFEDKTTMLPPNCKHELPRDAVPLTAWKVAGTVCFLPNDSVENRFCIHAVKSWGCSFESFIILMMYYLLRTVTRRSVWVAHLYEFVNTRCIVPSMDGRENPWIINVRTWNVMYCGSKFAYVCDRCLWNVGYQSIKLYCAIFQHMALFVLAAIRISDQEVSVCAW